MHMQFTEIIAGVFVSINNLLSIVSSCNPLFLWLLIDFYYFLRQTLCGIVVRSWTSIATQAIRAREGSFICQVNEFSPGSACEENWVVSSRCGCGCGTLTYIVSIIAIMGFSASCNSTIYGQITVKSYSRIDLFHTFNDLFTVHYTKH